MPLKLQAGALEKVKSKEKIQPLFMKHLLCTSVLCTAYIFNSLTTVLSIKLFFFKVTFVFVCMCMHMWVCIHCHGARKSEEDTCGS